MTRVVTGFDSIETGYKITNLLFLSDIVIYTSVRRRRTTVRKHLVHIYSIQHQVLV